MASHEFHRKVRGSEEEIRGSGHVCYSCTLCPSIDTGATGFPAPLRHLPRPPGKLSPASVPGSQAQLGSRGSAWSRESDFGLAAKPVRRCRGKSGREAAYANACVASEVRDMGRLPSRDDFPRNVTLKVIPRECLNV